MSQGVLVLLCQSFCYNFSVIDAGYETCNMSSSWFGSLFCGTTCAPNYFDSNIYYFLAFKKNKK